MLLIVFKCIVYIFVCATFYIYILVPYQLRSLMGIHRLKMLGLLDVAVALGSGFYFLSVASSALLNPGLKIRLVPHCESETPWTEVWST